jgi:large subunit ribosomal protein L23
MTEKTESVKNPAENVNRYTLLVHKHANKELIRQALHKIYKVNAVKINTLVARGKAKRFRYKAILMPSKKKAIVTLAPGQSINFVKGS